MKTYLGQLISVKKQDSQYTVTVSFIYDIIHGNITQTMTFNQKRWPKPLTGYLDVDPERMPPVFIDCDFTKVDVEYQDIQDGREHYTVISGFNGTPKVIGFYDRPLCYKVAYHPNSKHLAFFPIQPRSYRVLDGRIKYYATPTSRNYRQGHLPDGHILGISTLATTWTSVAKDVKRVIPGPDYRNRPFDTYVLKCIRLALKNKTFEKSRSHETHTFDVEVKLHLCKDFYSLKEYVRQTFLKRMELDRDGVWNLLFLQPALHDMYQDNALYWFSSYSSNRKHEFFDTGDHLTGSVVTKPTISASEADAVMVDSNAGTTTYAVGTRMVDWDDPNEVQEMVDSWSDEPDLYHDHYAVDDFSSSLRSLEYTFIEGHYISGYEALNTKEQAAPIQQKFESGDVPSDPLDANQWQSDKEDLSLTRQEKRQRQYENLLIEHPSFFSYALAVPFGFEAFSDWYRYEQEILPKHGDLEISYFWLYEKKMIEYYKALGYEETERWFDSSYFDNPIVRALQSAFTSEFLSKVNRGELHFPILDVPYS
jgi:hypothetical protein